MQRHGRATIKDVAQLAGVSVTTVSHALNGKGVVRRETIRQVQRAAAEIGYRAHPIARGLRSSRLGILALVIRPFRTLDTFLPEGVDYFLRLAGAASLSAMEHGYSMMLVGDPTLPHVPASALAADAYIVMEPFERDPVLTLLTEQHIPFVTIGADPSRRGEFVEIDGGAAHQIHLMTTHLVDAGAKRIALVSGTDRNDWNLTAQRTFIDWHTARKSRPLMLALPETEGEQVGDAVFDHFFAADAAPHPDAILCLTGRHATGVIAAATRRSIKVPDDLLVAAASGTIHNRTARPTVTTLDLHPEATAWLTVEVAVGLAEGRAPNTALRVPAASLTVRESTSRRSAGIL